MLSKGLPVEISLLLKYLNDLDESCPISYDIWKECLYSDILKRYVGIPSNRFDLHWREKESESSESDNGDSYEFSQDSSESFDPMAAKIVEHQAREYQRKETKSKANRTYNIENVEEEKEISNHPKQRLPHDWKKLTHGDHSFDKNLLASPDANQYIEKWNYASALQEIKRGPKGENADTNQLFASSANIKLDLEPLERNKIRHFSPHQSVFLTHKRTK